MYRRCKDCHARRKECKCKSAVVAQQQRQGCGCSGQKIIYQPGENHQLSESEEVRTHIVIGGYSCALIHIDRLIQSAINRIAQGGPGLNIVHLYFGDNLYANSRVIDKDFPEAVIDNGGVYSCNKVALIRDNDLQNDDDDGTDTTDFYHLMLPYGLGSDAITGYKVQIGPGLVTNRMAHQLDYLSSHHTIFFPFTAAEQRIADHLSQPYIPSKGFYGFGIPETETGRVSFPAIFINHWQFLQSFHNSPDSATRYVLQNIYFELQDIAMNPTKYPGICYRSYSNINDIFFHNSGIRDPDHPNKFLYDVTFVQEFVQHCPDVLDPIGHNNPDIGVHPCGVTGAGPTGPFLTATGKVSIRTNEFDTVRIATEGCLDTLRGHTHYTVAPGDPQCLLAPIQYRATYAVPRYYSDSSGSTVVQIDQLDQLISMTLPSQADPGSKKISWLIDFYTVLEDPKSKNYVSAEDQMLLVVEGSNISCLRPLTWNPLTQQFSLQRLLDITEDSLLQEFNTIVAKIAYAYGATVCNIDGVAGQPFLLYSQPRCTSTATFDSIPSPCANVGVCQAADLTTDTPTYMNSNIMLRNACVCAYPPNILTPA